MIVIHKDILEVNPEGELKEIELIYRAKGIPADQAAQMAIELMNDKNSAHQFLVKLTLKKITTSDFLMQLIFL